MAVRSRLGLSQAKLGLQLGITPQTVSAWERGEAYPRLDTAQKLAELAGVTVDWLLSGRQNGTGANVVHYLEAGRRVPKLGDTVSSGLSVSKKRPKEFVATHFPCSAKSYALQVVGDSMAPEVLSGDVVVFDPELEPVPGDLVHVVLDNGEVLFRKYRPQRSVRGTPVEYDLVPVSADWPTIRVGPDNPGKIKGVMSERITPRRRA